MNYAKPLGRSLMAAAILLPVTSGAVVLSYESFSGYTAGELPAQNPSVPGYTGAWTDVAFGDAEPGITTGSLAYSNPLYAGSSGAKVSKGADAAGIVLGARVPIILTSRADAVMTRLASCGIAVLVAQARREAAQKAVA